jgi:hypothetical protein
LIAFSLAGKIVISKFPQLSEPLWRIAIVDNPNNLNDPNYHPTYSDWCSACHDFTRETCAHHPEPTIPVNNAPDGQLAIFKTTAINASENISIIAEAPTTMRMTRDEFMRRMLDAFPDAEVWQDSLDEIVIYPRLKEMADGMIVSIDHDHDSL